MPRIQNVLLNPPGNALLDLVFYAPVRRYFFPAWSVDRTHGIHAGPAVRISMVLILWSFTGIVLFAPPNFGRVHPKLAVFNFLTPMIVLVIGYLADFVKGGEFSETQHKRLRWARYGLRVWWLLGGALYLYCYLIFDCFKHEVIQLGVGFFGVPLLAIAVMVVWFMWWPKCRNKAEDMLSRLGACQWALYSIQWTALVFQIWIFIWTINRETLGISLWEMLFGKNYFHELKEQISIRELWSQISVFEFPHIPFPHGGIYFIFIIILIGLFIIRHSYRLQQIGMINDRSHQIAASISVAVLVIPLCYISILTFAHTIYPYIPFEKGGGDYSDTPTVHFTFNADIKTKTNLSANCAMQLLPSNSLNCLIVIDENANVIYVAATNGEDGGPASWRNGASRPKVYEIRQDAVATVLR